MNNSAKNVNNSSGLKGRGGPGRGQGRKPTVQGEKLEVISFRGTPAQREKLKVLGHGWLRAQLDAVSVPGV